MHSRMYLHLVWTTWRREPIITVSLAGFLCRFLASVARQEHARVLSLGIVSTHIHVLLRVQPTTSLPRLIQRMKGGSSVIARKEGVTGNGALKWARGYSVHTVGGRQLEGIISYLEAQPTHHPEEAIPGWSGGRKADLA
jgi:REP element-mobilizing transposase RayT